MGPRRCQDDGKGSEQLEMAGKHVRGVQYYTCSRKVVASEFVYLSVLRQVHSNEQCCGRGLLTDDHC